MVSVWPQIILPTLPFIPCYKCYGCYGMLWNLLENPPQMLLGTSESGLILV